MVFSEELGYDPDEWEECSESQQFMLFGFYTRMFLTFSSLALTLLFFWLLEARKQSEKLNNNNDNKISKNVDNIKRKELEAVKEKLKELEETRKDILSFSKEESEALEEWQREVARMERSRLQDLEGYVVDASGAISEIDTESQLIDRFLPADHISLDTNSAETEQFQAQLEVDQMSQLFLTRQTIDSDAANYSSPKRARNIIVKGAGRENGSINSRNDWKANEQSEFYGEQTAEFAYKSNVKDGLPQGSDDDFVKVYKESGNEVVADDFMVPKQLKTNEVTKLTLSNVMQKRSQHLQEATITQSSNVKSEMIGIDQSKTNLKNQVLNIRKSAEIDINEVIKLRKPMEAGRRYELLDETSNGNELSCSFTSKTRIMEMEKNVLEDLEEDKRLLEAEMYVHDAIEYVNNKASTNITTYLRDQSTGFVIEEAMLDSTEQSHNQFNNISSGQYRQEVSPEDTSQMIKTNEVFEKVEELIGIDDSMTYAPEIQSIEISPDEASINSENLLEYFDQVAAECTDIFNLPLPQSMKVTESLSNLKQLEPSHSITSLRSNKSFTSSGSHSRIRKQSSLLSVLGVTSMQEMLLALTSLEDLSGAMRKAGLLSTNLIFGIDYTASNKYQGERCFEGRSLHSLDISKENPYQQVIKIMGRTLAPFATSGYIPAYGFGDSKTGDWSVFKLKTEGECKDFDEVLRVYDTITPTITLSGPTNFAPLIYQAIEICEKVQDYHILVIVADGQVTNEKATRKAIVQACQYPLSIIVVGVGDGPWEMMKVFDESLPKRPWDNFHFVQFHELMQKADNVDAGKLSFAVQSLLEVPDQYNMIRQLGLLRSAPPISK